MDGLMFANSTIFVFGTLSIKAVSINMKHRSIFYPISDNDLKVTEGI